VLAHWESQSFWQEQYTDLYDFCRCLGKRCEDRLATLKKIAGANGGGFDTLLTDIRDACAEIIKRLLPKRQDGMEPLVVRADNFGPVYQYAHGLSIYFPWSQPIEDKGDEDDNANNMKRLTPEERSRQAIKNYSKYAFNNKEHFSPSWLDFLKVYFEETRRRARPFESTFPADVPPEWESGYRFAKNEKDLAKLSIIGTSAKHSTGALEKGSPEMTKGAPSEGASCDCPSIKNYVTQGFFVTPGAAKAYEDDNDEY
jgi:hypothetical protein